MNIKEKLDNHLLVVCAWRLDRNIDAEQYVDALDKLVKLTQEECKQQEKMKFKDYRPIHFEIFQSDMEKIMYQLNKVKNAATSHDIDFKQIGLIVDDFQRKIKIHEERGEWI